MEIDPHTIQQILEKVRSQLRCPQCTKKVPVALECLKVVGETFAVFQLKCGTCDAYILLHATIRTFPTPHVHSAHAEVAMLCKEQQEGRVRNFSTTLEIDPQELQTLRACLKDAGGRFSMIFEGDA